MSATEYVFHVLSEIGLLPVGFVSGFAPQPRQMSIKVTDVFRWTDGQLAAKLFRYGVVLDAIGRHVDDTGQIFEYIVVHIRERGDDERKG